LIFRNTALPSSRTDVQKIAHGVQVLAQTCSQSPTHQVRHDALYDQLAGFIDGHRRDGGVVATKDYQA
jgi:hypothetical protein